jgi:hypothetical protein
VELFNLKEDRMEKNNQAVAQPVLTAKLQDRLMRWLDETHAGIPTELNPAYIPSDK